MAPGYGPASRGPRPRRRRSLRWGTTLGRWRALALVVAFGAAALSLRYAAPEGSPLRYAVYVLVAVPLALPACLLLAQWSARLARRVGARRQVLRARRVFRTALCAARHHPELCDLERVREAAALLSRHFAATAGDAGAGAAPARPRFPEVEEAAQHPYAPLRNAACRVLQASAVRPPAADNQKTPS